MSPPLLNWLLINWRTFPSRRDIFRFFIRHFLAAVVFLFGLSVEGRSISFKLSADCYSSRLLLYLDDGEAFFLRLLFVP